MKKIVFFFFVVFIGFNLQSIASEKSHKIALIGGSAARGYDGLRGIAEIIKADLKQYFPVEKISITPFWGIINPDPFVRGQVLIAKNEIDNFDTFIIYTGNTEVKNYLHDSQLFIKEEFRHLYSIRKNHFPDLNEDETKSDLKKIKSKIKNKLIQWGIVEPEEPVSHYHFPRFSRYANDSVPPQSLFKQALVDFENELESLIKLGATKNKKFILVTLPSNLAWTPWFSYGEKKNAEFFYESGMKKLSQKKFNEAFSALKKARDLDGFFSRTVSAQHQALFHLSKKYKNVHLLDAEEVVLSLIKKEEATFDELFSSLQHLSFKGNIFVSRGILCKMVENCPKELLMNKDLDILVTEYQQKMHVTKDEIKENNFMIARWHLAMSDLASRPESFYQQSEQYLIKYKQDLNATDDQTKYHLYSALLKLKQGKKPEGLSLANLALSQNKSDMVHFKQVLNELLPNGLPLKTALEQGGLFFIKSENKFDLK